MFGDDSGNGSKRSTTVTIDVQCDLPTFAITPSKREHGNLGACGSGAAFRAGSFFHEDTGTKCA
jgi:hypothetical protein